MNSQSTDVSTRALRTAAVVAVGSELLGTDRLDTNSLRIAGLLRRYGIDLVVKLVVGDDEGRMVSAMDQACREADLVIVTGGLGPTLDDRTRGAASALTGKPLCVDQALLATIEDMYRRRGAKMPATNIRQAQVLEGSEVLANARGTAPGLRFHHGESAIFLLPGVPTEVEGLLESAVEPWIATFNSLTKQCTSEVRVACLPESLVEERIAELYREFGTDGVAVLAKPGEVLIRLNGTNDKQRGDMVAAVESVLGSAVFSVSLSGDEQPGDEQSGGELSEVGSTSLEAVVLAALAQAEETLTTAESCTGGLIGTRLTEVPGSSTSYLGGAVTYSNDLKAEVLGVSAGLIEQYGAVSSQVAYAMALGAVRRFKSNWAVSVTGVAGPGGGSREKPVGTVWFGLCGSPAGASGGDQGGDPGRDHEGGKPEVAKTFCLRFPGDRARVRLQASQFALDLVRRQVLRLPALTESPWLVSNIESHSYDQPHS